MASMDREVKQILTLLRSKIRESGYTQIQVQRQLDWGRSYISQLLNRGKALRVEQVLKILETIKVEPREFYAELYQFPRPEAHLRNLDEYAEPEALDAASFTKILGEDAAEADGLSDDFFRNYRELRAMVRAVVQVLIENEMVTIEDFADKARAAEPGLRRRP